MLTQEQIEGNWKEIKGGLRNLWGRITDNELEQIKGNITEVTGLVEKRYGETKLEIKEKLNNLLRSFDNNTDKNIDPDRTSYQRNPVPGEEEHPKGLFKPSSFEKDSHA